ncbi:MAG: hypothetical protein P1Q69_06340 [Candidatus Thorarchaeota archaeon]|nr:hypothetical protein [Candidatus Thorarchaeota archaeon]
MSTNVPEAVAKKSISPYFAAVIIAVVALLTPFAIMIRPDSLGIRGLFAMLWTHSYYSIPHFLINPILMIVFIPIHFSG